MFLEASGIGQRLRDGHACDLLEIGFGLGTTALVSADEAYSHGTDLSICSVEYDPITASDLAECRHEAWLRAPDLATRLQRAWQQVDTRPAADATGTDAATPSLTIALSERPRISLTLIAADVATLCLPSASCDAVYLDGFSPARNPVPWSPPVLAQLQRAMRPGAQLVTYSSRGQLRRDLISLGLDVQRLPGPPGKREMLRATQRS